MRIPPPVVMITAMLFMWTMSVFMPQLNFTLPFGLEPYRWILAALFILDGLILESTAIWSFIKSKTTITPISPDKTTKLVTTGFYRFTRNPMYLGMVALILGVGVYLGTWSLIIGAAGYIYYINKFQIPAEESALTKLFGSDYEAYKQSVRRWL